jgi:hypothetical protein
MIAFTLAQSSRKHTKSFSCSYSFLFKSHLFDTQTCKCNHYFIDNLNKQNKGLREEVCKTVGEIAFGFWGCEMIILVVNSFIGLWDISYLILQGCCYRTRRFSSLSAWISSSLYSLDFVQSLWCTLTVVEMEKHSRSKSVGPWTRWRQHTSLSQSSVYQLVSRLTTVILNAMLKTHSTFEASCSKLDSS